MLLFKPPIILEQKNNSIIEVFVEMKYNMRIIFTVTVRNIIFVAKKPVKAKDRFNPDIK